MTAVAMTTMMTMMMLIVCWSLRSFLHSNRLPPNNDVDEMQPEEEPSPQPYDGAEPEQL
jgi:hypothetical protein